MLKTVMLVSFLFDLFKHINMLEIIVTLFFFLIVESVHVHVAKIQNTVLAPRTVGNCCFDYVF